MKIIDISPLISEKIAVFPGDTAFSRQVALDFLQGDHLLLSSIKTTLHLGAHADAVSHYSAKGEGIDQKSLTPYLGKVQLIEVSLEPGARIYPQNVEAILAPRVIFKTNSFDPDQWTDDFVSLSPELIEDLSQKGVVLVGIDTPSVDPAQSKKLESHQALFKTKMSVLEGLDLSAALPGIYTLIALPLKIKDADASPVRAILVPDLNFL